MNQPSDNYIAEMLSKGLGSQFGGEGSTEAGGAVVREAVEPFGISPTIVDGSGLSRANRTSAARGRAAAQEPGRVRGRRRPSTRRWP